ncbi:PREDICTED: probable LRR receptor-like serine/threonine-protein kinase At1g06840 isoform X2 [Tarenaya hassleriana]|uniref:probable LRR receptor-like serine/threonine-protein kinase At1g06840 isoform X2 n=1 Tax=Tarenaya hassleriana TaxID=28532 RepID=UPI0008FD3212|nr:PREDICTED: probable LRR receptor-like serine/threonine-protein kinase At1g06840 isoform X2 [Tarenaya hassleriana]
MVSFHRAYGYLLVAAFCCLALLADGQRTDPSEVYCLRTVKRSLIDPMKNLRNWKKGDPCTANWTGVFCFDEIGTDGYLHIRQLRLMNMNLSGILAPELRKLSHLEILNFMWNSLTGSIPKELGEISSMKLLLLNGNQLSGSLPSELGYLSNLNRFQIDENNITGPIPKSFSHLINVKHLHFNNNSLSGEIPVELANLTNILHLLLDSNNLSGILPPQLSALPNLRILQLDNNNFRGSLIPATYGNFSKLVKLSLRNCSLEGALPDFSGMPNLTYLDLSRNELTGPIPPSKLSRAITTIDLSDNKLNLSIPESLSELPLLQKLSLKNNLLSGSVLDSLWQKISFHTNSRLKLDLRNNSLSSLQGVLNPPANVTLMLDGNPICKNRSISNIALFCGSDGEDWISTNSTNSSVDCPAQACPTSDFYEYNLASPLRCFCAAPLRIGYRLKSPSFSYFPPYIIQFEDYVTSSLDMALYQLWIDSYQWEEGPRLRMYMKLFPRVNESYSRTFNESEVHRLRGMFSSWKFRGSDFFGPYELLNFTLFGPYSYVDFNTQRDGISRGVLAAITVGAVVTVVAFLAIATTWVIRRHRRHQHEISKRRSSHHSSKVLKIDGIREFSFRELARATDNFSDSTLIGSGGYGKVYRGTLSDKTIAAIKRADEESLQGEKEFLNEIELLSRLHHRNLVSLIGYCDEEGEQMLVYEFMPNGTLRDWLSGTKVLRLLKLRRL